MMMYEKAIENFARERKKYHESELKKEIANYNRRVEKMTATGECEVIHCEICPLWILRENREYGICRKMTKEQVRKLIAMEVEN